MHATLTTLRQKATTNPLDRLNPRRRRHVESVKEYLWWHGGKLTLDAETYARLRDEMKIEPYQVDAAVDDGFALGIFEMSGGGHIRVEYTAMLRATA